MTHTGKRRHARYQVSDVRGSLLFRTQVEVLNVSVSGLAIQTTERLQLGRTYTIRLAGGGEEIDVTGTIRWCHLARSRPKPNGEPEPVYEAGLALHGVLSGKGQELVGFLEQHVVLSPHQRLTGRFESVTLAPADLEARYDFEVLKLSLSGMLVRTQLEPALDASYTIELGLGEGEGAVRVTGRIAYVQRDPAALNGPMTQLGLEFVDATEGTRSALSQFIANELDQPPEEPGA